MKHAEVLGRERMEERYEMRVAAPTYGAASKTWRRRMLGSQYAASTNIATDRMEQPAASHSKTPGFGLECTVGLRIGAWRWSSAAAREEPSDECEVDCNELLGVTRERITGCFRPGTGIRSTTYPRRCGSYSRNILPHAPRTAFHLDSILCCISMYANLQNRLCR